METIYKQPNGKAQWEDDVTNDLSKTKLIKWTEKVQNRLKWKEIVDKTKTVPDLQ